MRARRLVQAFLFLSGATALVYQLVWSKYLGNLLGNTGQAHAIVLATFMGGLALGAFLFGRTADRVKRPLGLYGLLELGIGVYALCFPPILEALGAVYLAVAPATPEALRAVPRLLLAASSLVVPTVLMGGTLPALVRHFARGLGDVRGELSRLYAINSLGAASGVFLAGVSWVPGFGLLASSRGAALCNVVLALCAIALARAGSAREPEEGTTDDDALAYPARAIRVALWCTALSGFTAMLLEVVWIRLLAITLGASTYAFTLILTAFISGIGAGSYWLSRRRTEGDSLLLFARLQVGLLLLICLSVPLAVRLPWLFWRARSLLDRSVEAWPLYQTVTFAFCCLVLFVPAFLMGAGFPSIARVATAKAKELGGQIGRAYLWNTVGTVGGAAVGGLWLLPALGLEWCMALCAGSALLAAGLAFRAAPGRAELKWNARIVALPAAALLSLALLATHAGWARFLASASTFRETRAAPATFAEFKDWISTVDGQEVEVLFHQDDTFASVLVARVKNIGFQYLRINGKIDASTGRDMETQIIVGHAGPLFHPGQAKRVLVIGAGSAVTVGSILTHPVEVVDVVEISPAVIDAAHHFKDFNRDAMTDPRVRVHAEDAKTFLGLQPEKYDLIVSQPSNPWVAGVAGLFSRDFFQVARAHLNEDGLLVQWIHTYESDDSVLQLVVRTLRDTFPHATAWLGPQDLVMVAGPTRQTVDLQTLATRMARPEVADDLGRVGMDRPSALLARQLLTEEGLAAFAGQGAVNTDDHNVLEYLAPIAFFVKKTARTPDERRRPGATPLFFAQLQEDGRFTADDRESVYRNLARAQPPGDPLVRGAAEAWAHAAPSVAAAHLAVARSALAQSEISRAAQAVEAAFALDEDSLEVSRAWLEVEARRQKAQNLFFKEDRADLARAQRHLTMLKAAPADAALAEELVRVEEWFPKPSESLRAVLPEASSR
jgi:spermidine synthase